MSRQLSMPAWYLATQGLAGRILPRRPYKVHESRHPATELERNMGFLSSMVGELMPSMGSPDVSTTPSTPSMPSIDPGMAGELMPSFGSDFLPSDFLPSFEALPDVGELMSPFPSDFLPSMPSMPDVDPTALGEMMPSLPSDFLPSFEAMPDVGELMGPFGSDFLPSMPSMPELPSMPSIDPSQAGELMGWF